MKFKQCWKRREKPLPSEWICLAPYFQQSLITCTICVWGGSSPFGISQLFPYKFVPKLSLRQTGGVRSLPISFQTIPGGLTPLSTSCRAMHTGSCKNATLAAGNTNPSLQCTLGTKKPQTPNMFHGKGALHWPQGRMTPMLCRAGVAPQAKQLVAWLFPAEQSRKTAEA